MLDKHDIGERFAKEMERLELKAGRISEKTGVTIQAINGWRKSGRIARKHHPALQKMGINVTWMLTGDESHYSATHTGRVAMDHDRLTEALQRLHKTLGTSGIDLECLTMTVENVDPLIARRNVSFSAKALMYKMIYEELLNDQAKSKTEVAEIIRNILRGSNENDGERP